MQQQDDALISMKKEVIWQAHEHNHTSKSADWFWVLGILAVSISIVAILFRNFFFALLILVAAFTLALLAKRVPRTMQFKLDEQGLLVGTQLYTWKTIQVYRITSPETSPILLIGTTKIFSPHLSIPIPIHKVEDIRTILSKNVKEGEINEPASHKIIEFFGL